MKKLVLLALLAVGAAAQAEDFTYLTTSGTAGQQSIELAAIRKITFRDGQMVVATNQGSEAFLLADLEQMFFSSEATGIAEMDNGQRTTDNGQAVCDLSGRRVVNPRRGLYIVNGKKVVIP